MAAGQADDADRQVKLADEIKRLRQDFANLHVKASNEPKAAEVRYQLALLAEQLDRPDLAAVWLKAVLALDPRHAKALQKLQSGP